MSPSELRTNAIDDLMTMSNVESRRFVRHAYDRWTEWLQENAIDFLSFQAGTTVVKALNTMAGTWLETTEAGRVYLEAYAADLQVA